MEMNATPLIDVMMVLLIMLIITIPAQLHAVNLSMSTQTSIDQKINPMVIKLDVDAANVISWNGQPLASRDELESKLREASEFQPQPELHIRSHAKAKYRSVAGVMASAQRNGLGKIAILGSEQFAH